MKHSPAFGIVQGRLTRSPAHKLQWFPQLEWKREFEIASKLGLDYIELIVERRHNPKNPIWSQAGIEQITQLTKHHKLTIHSLCNDYVIDHCIVARSQVFHQTTKLISIGKSFGVKKLVLPLFEESELTKSNYREYKNLLIELGDACLENDMILCLETILDGRQLLEIMIDLHHKGIFCVFDTGNRIAHNHDIYRDLLLLRNYIRHVHIKDKNDDDENVLLGTGKVNFGRVFKSLSEIGYSGPYTFETTRGNNPVETAKYNLLFCKFFINDTIEN